MKKAVTFLFAILVALAGLTAKAQQISANVKSHVPLTVATHTTAFGEYVRTGTPIFCLTDTGVIYIVKKDFSAASNLHTVFAAGAGYYTWNPTSPYTTISIEGQTLSQLNLNCLKANNSIKATDTLFGSTDSIVGKGIFGGAVSVGGALGVTGATTLSAGLTGTTATFHEAASTANIAQFYNDKTSAGDSGIVINKLGYVGIGKATASVPLDVVGAANISGTTTLAGATPLVFTGTVTKGLEFAGVTPSFSDDDNAWISMGSWNDAIAITGQTSHFVPLQINITSGTSVAKDFAAARFKTQTAAANTLTAFQNTELRSTVSHNVGGHTNLGVSTNVAGASTCTGDFLAGYFNIQGSGNITSTNHVNVLEATNTHTGTGVVNVAHFTNNATGAGATNVMKAENIVGTATSLIDATRTAGTVTNGVKVTGTVTNAINLSGTSGVIYGNAYIADTAHFGTDASGNRNKYIRKKIDGVAATDVFVVSPVMATGVAVPGTAEFLGYYCTTDSLVISRNTASTAGMAVSWIRIKK